MLIKSIRKDLAGLEAVVVGRSNIVGKPMALLLMAKGPGGDATVTVAQGAGRVLGPRFVDAHRPMMPFPAMRCPH